MDRFVRARHRRRRAAWILAFALTEGSPVAADTVAKLSEELQKVLAKRKADLADELRTATEATARGVVLAKEGDLAADGKRLQKTSDVLAQMERDLDRIHVALDVGAAADKSGPSDLSRLNVDTAIAKGQYPQQFRFRAGTRLQVRDGALQEEVAALVANVDYYVMPFLETFAFAERMSDSFLSIRQRYELGGGFKLEHSLWPKLSPQQEAARLAYNRELEAGFASLGDDLQTRALYDAFRMRARDIERGTNKLLARLTVGLSFSAFAEIEQPLIETVAITARPDGVTSEQVVKETLRARSRYRAAVRPSIVVQPVRGLKTTALVYYKVPLGAPWKVDGRLDTRTDLFLISELNLDKDADGASVSVVGQFEHHYDSVPPRIPAEVIAQHQAQGRTLRQVVANRRHAAFVLKIRFNF